MQQLNANLLPGSALSLNQYGHIGFGYPFYFVTGSMHGRGFAEEDIHRRQVERANGLSIMNQGHFPVLERPAE